MVILMIKMRGESAECHTEPAVAACMTFQILIQIELIHTPGVSPESILSWHLTWAGDFPVTGHVETCLLDSSGLGCTSFPSSLQQFIKECSVLTRHTQRLKSRELFHVLGELWGCYKWGSWPIALHWVWAKNRNDLFLIRCIFNGIISSLIKDWLKVLK